MTAESIAQSLGRHSRHGNGFMAQCPAHDDKNPSLSISDDEDGKILVHCKAGCSQNAVVTALKDHGLWPKQTSSDMPKVKQAITGRYLYHDENGALAHEKERLEPGKDGGKKDFRFWHEGTDGKKVYSRRGGRKLLYHLPDVIKTKAVIITEGEKHADLLKEWGLTGTTFDRGANSKPTPEEVEQLTGKRIAILRDNDKAGLNYALTLVNALQGKCESLKVVLLPGLPDKGDICDWIKEPGNDKARLLEIVKSTPEWEPSEPAPEENESPAFDLSRLTLGSDITAGNHSVTFVVDKLIPEQSISLFYAKGGSGKSTVATQIAAAVVSGTPFMGLATLQRPVVVIDYENPLAVLSKRINAVEGAGGVHFWTGSNSPPQLNKTVWQELKALVATLKNPLIIIDTLSSACSGLDILSNGDYSPVMGKIVELRNCGATIVLLHHTPKQDETKYIGASTIYNNSDHILAMYPVKTPDSQKEMTDEDDAKIYRLGTKDKTRFEHFAMYIEFDEDKSAFVLAADPDKEIVDRILKIIEEQAPVNQTAIRNQIGADISKSKLTHLLKRNEGRFWTVESGANNAKIYRPFRFPGFPPLYSQKTGKPESGFSRPPEKPDTTDTMQMPFNNGFTGYPDGNSKPENVPVFDESDFANMGTL